MVRRVGFLLVVTCALTFGGAWAALGGDNWDYSNSNDNAANTTTNRLVHGSSQQHSLQDLAGPLGDVDWYQVYANGRSSYEVAIDGFSENVPVMTRYTADGSTSLAGGLDVDGEPYAYALRWMNTTASAAEQRVRVVAIGTGNSFYDRYDIRMFETTIFLARFNNTGTQTTVLICQNPTGSGINANEYFWNEAGTLLATNAVTIGAHATSVASGVSGTTGQKGSVTVAHDGPYGSLNCKSVALEPSTGYSFDTPGVYRVK